MTLIRHRDVIYDPKKLGVRTRDLIISSPVPINNLVEVEGALGAIDYGTTYAPRPITAYYRAQSIDIVDFSLLRDELFAIFRTEEPFYLIEKRLPGKQWLVKVSNPYSVPQVNVFGNFEIDLLALRGVSESIGTTQDIERHGGITYDSELWSYGMGLLHDDESHKYTHNTKDFRIYNAGNIAIHPFQQELEIVIENAQKGYQLKNKTTGDIFKYTGNTTGTLRLDDANITMNKLQTLRDTNKKFITIAPGWNEFEQNQNCKVSFDFPFYYL